MMLPQGQGHYAHLIPPGFERVKVVRIDSSTVELWYDHPDGRRHFVRVNWHDGAVPRIWALRHADTRYLCDS